MADIEIRREDIQGWGVDLDPKNRPAVPKEKFPVNGTGAHWIKPDQQIPRVKVFHSIERPGLTPVFGTTAPPRGLSGVIRHQAFKLSEGRISHWMLLLLADRVDMVEGIFTDLARGHIPNLWKELGWSVDVKHNPKAFVRRGLVAAAIIGAGVYLMRSRRRRITTT